MADAGRLTGFKNDRINGYLEVWVRGTNVARFDDGTADLTLLVNGLRLDSGSVTVDTGGITVTAGALSVDATTNSASTVTGSIHTDGGLGVVKNTYIGGSLLGTGKVTFYDQLVHSSADVETLTQAKTLDAQDTGKIFESALDSMVYTLPATAYGYTFTFVNTAADSSAKLSISPHSDDKIMGPDIAGVDDKDLINTAATQDKGDTVTLVGDGSLGYYVHYIHGTWAAEA